MYSVLFVHGHDLMRNATHWNTWRHHAFIWLISIVMRWLKLGEFMNVLWFQSSVRREKLLISQSYVDIISFRFNSKFILSYQIQVKQIKKSWWPSLRCVVRQLHLVVSCTHYMFSVFVAVLPTCQKQTSYDVI